jgi:hypothetical protein
MKKYKRAIKLKEFLHIYESRDSKVVKTIMPLMDLKYHEHHQRFLNLVKKYRDGEIFRAYYTKSGNIKYYLINKQDKVRLV